KPGVEAVEVLPDAAEGLDGLGLGDDVEAAALGQQEADAREGFEVAGAAAAGPPDTLGDGVEAAVGDAIEGEDGVGLAEVAAPQYEHVGPVDAHAVAVAHGITRPGAPRRRGRG